MSNLTDFFPSGGGGLEGTQYVFVQANGTDVENAIELQAAYDLAITKIQTFDVLSAPYDFSNQQTPTTLDFFDFGGTLPVLIVGQTYTFNVEGVDMIGEVVQGGFESTVEFPTAFTYNGGDVRVYVSESINSIVVAAPGNYNFENGNFIMDTEYVDLVSLDSNRSIVFNGANTIQITANNVFVKGVDVLRKAFIISASLPNLIVENCKGGSYSFGHYVNASGTFNYCIGGDYSFGAYSTASGTFNYCVGGNGSFASAGTASGTFNYCKGPNVFGVIGTASGTFNYCIAGNGFGAWGVASGVFNYCVGKVVAFGGYGTASGTFNYCVADELSFGAENQNDPGAGALTGTLYYCRLRSGTFRTKSGAGRTILCIDGNNNQNNQ